VRLAKIAVAARKRVAKKLEDDALVSVDDAEKNSEVEAKVVERLEMVVVANVGVLVNA
jgi:hypothetical protein